MNKLVYDSQARLYSTCSAYGKTWELTRIESDGTQHWQSGKQSAVVQKMAERDTEGPYAKHFPMQDEPLAGIAAVNKQIEQEYGNRDPEQRAMAIGALARRYGLTVAPGYEEAIHTRCRQIVSERRASLKQPEEMLTVDPDAVHRAIYVSPVEAAIRARNKANKQHPGSKDPPPESWVFDGNEVEAAVHVRSGVRRNAAIEGMQLHYGVTLHPAGHSYQAGRVSGKSIDIKKIF